MAADEFGSGGAFPVNTLTVGEQSYPQTIYMADGRILIVWHSDDPDADGDGYAIRAQFFDASGDRIGSEFIINSSTAGNQTQPQIALLADGRFVVAWMTGAVQGDSSGDQVLARIFNADGTPTGAEFAASDPLLGGAFEPVVTALDNGGFAIGWTSVGGASGGNRIQIFDASGVANGIEFDPSVDGGATTYDLSLSTLSGGRIIVVWAQAGVGIVGRIFGADGTPQGDEILLGNAQLEAFADPGVAGLADGGFALVWRGISYAGASLVNESFVQTFDGNGNPSSALQRLGVFGPASGSQIEAFDDGGFVIAGMINDQFSGPSLYAFRFDGAAGRIGLPVLVSGLSNFVSATPDIAIAPNGDIAAAWTTISPIFDGDRSAVAAAILTPFPVVNHAPDIISNGGEQFVELSIAENSAALTTVQASDADGDAIRYSIIGGEDAALFTIDPQTGVLSFINAPDFEAPNSASGGNFYQVQVAADDGRLSTSQFLLVTVTNVREGVTIIGTRGSDSVDAGNSVRGQPLPGQGDDSIFGLGGDDELHGLGGDDVIEGGSGNDDLFGGSGNDELLGGTGNDRLIGGSGADLLTGGSGRDIFTFRNLTDSQYGAVDIITDFSHAERDRFDFSAIDANINRPGNQAFTFIGDVGFSGAAGELRTDFAFDGFGNQYRAIFGDVDGDTIADFEVWLVGNVDLPPTDFIL